MKTKPTDKPDSEVVQVSLTIKQVKALERLVSCDLVDAEQYGESMIPEKDLQRLCDALWEHLHIPLTPDELAADHEQARERNLAANKAWEDEFARVKAAQEAV